MKIKAIKVFDSSTHTIRIKCDQNYAYNDVEKLLKAEEQYLNKKHGAIKGKLRDEFSTYSDNDSINVIICTKPPKYTYLDKTKFSKSEQIANSIARTKQKPAKSIRSVIEGAGISLNKVDRETDIAIECKVAKNILTKLAFNKDILSISKQEKGEPCTTAAPLSWAATSSAYNPSPLPTGCSGQGVNSATFETGIFL